MKKNIGKIKILFLLLGLFSCNDFGDVNIDPTKPTSMDPGKQLIYAQMRYTGDNSIQLRSGIGIIIPLLQQASGNFTTNSGATYAYSESIYSRVWLSDYPGVVRELIDASDNLAGDPDKTNLYAMVRIMKVITFLRLTDLYGDIPYSEATRGYSDLIVRPKYDRQEDIYNDFFKELKESHDMLDAGKDQVPQDQYYGGDIAKWKKLANSLRFRLAMRLTKVNPAKAQQEAEAAFAAGLMESNDDICYIKYENVQGSATDFRGNALSTAILAMADPPRFNTTFLDILNPPSNEGPVDPRLDGYSRCYLSLTPLVGGAALYTRADVTEQVRNHYAAAGNAAINGVIGLQPGAVSFVNNPAVQNITVDVPGRGSVTLVNKDQRRQMATYLYYMDAPALIVTYSEIALLLAEAKVRGWNMGSTTAEEYYQAGIRASIDQLSLFRDAPAFEGVDEFVESKTLTPGDELKEINTELYISLFLNPQENFANWRRSGYPELEPAGPPGRPIPRRLQYPLNEIEQNNGNVEEATKLISGVEPGKDSYLNRVWWDKE
ncbi:MAG: hypothetical protein ABS46_03720 [Cytophagaceae bacterium SCN 52-12]|nr:MAG: hypothetical protein ABS46_03720 [Cytophagaceae bacterium SCN 52-12]